MLITCEVTSEHITLSQKRQHVGAFLLVCPQVVGFVCTVRSRHLCLTFIAVVQLIGWSHVKWNLKSWSGPVDLLITLFTCGHDTQPIVVFVLDRWRRKRCDPSDAQQAFGAMLTCHSFHLRILFSMYAYFVCWCLCCAWHVIWRIS